MENPDIFTQKEIDELPLILQCCYYLFGWIKSVDIKTIEGFIDNFWLVFRDEDWETEEELRKRAKKEIEKLYNFTKRVQFNAYKEGYLEAQKNTINF